MPWWPAGAWRGAPAPPAVPPGRCRGSTPFAFTGCRPLGLPGSNLVGSVDDNTHRLGEGDGFLARVGHGDGTPRNIGEVKTPSPGPDTLPHPGTAVSVGIG